MLILHLCAFVGTLATGIAAIPAFPNNGITALSKRDAQYFYLRANW